MRKIADNAWACDVIHYCVFKEFEHIVPRKPAVTNLQIKKFQAVVSRPKFHGIRRISINPTKYNVHEADFPELSKTRARYDWIT